MARTLQEKYNQIKEGKGHKGVFLNEAKRLFPQFITNTTSLNEATTILKQKNIINEGTVGLGVSADFGKKQDWHKIFEEKLNQNNYDYEDKKKIDNMGGEQFQKGVYFEMEKVRNTVTSENLGELLEKARETVRKNLAKDSMFYLKNAAFGVDKLGYSDERPGLNPTQIKGKHKASGYGEASTTKPEKGEAGTGYIPVKEDKLSFKDLLKD